MDNWSSMLIKGVPIPRHVGQSSISGDCCAKLTKK